MRLLVGLGDHVAGGAVEVLAVALPAARGDRGDEGARALRPDGALRAHARAEWMELGPPLALAEPQLHPPARELIESGHALGHTDGMVGGQLDDAVPQADTSRALGGRPQEHLG